jgi:hypothetical protein
MITSGVIITHVSDARKFLIGVEKIPNASGTVTPGDNPGIN